LVFPELVTAPLYVGFTDRSIYLIIHAVQLI